MARSVSVTVYSYDVSRPSIRRRVAKALEARAVRVQKSVFEAYLNDREATQLFLSAEAELEEGDSLRMYVLSATGRSRSRVAGGAPICEEGAFWLL